jgi:cytochrome P450
VSHAVCDRATLPRELDLTALSRFADSKARHAQFARLRSEMPVAWHPHAEGGFWVATRHADVLRVSQDKENFGQGDGHLIGGLGHAAATAGAEAFAFRDGMAPFTPGAQRASIRLQPEALDALAPGVRARVAERLAMHAGCGAIDFVELIAPLAAEVRATLAGVPAAHQDRLIAWIDTLGGRRGGSTHESDEERRSAAARLFEYSEQLLGRKRERAGEDLISDWLQDDTPSQNVSPRQVGVFLYSFIAVGSASARNVAAAGQRLLFDTPDVAARLRREPALVPDAVEEMLRLAPPFHYARRTALRDTVLAGQRIAKGDVITLWLGSANRDANVFEDAERFEVALPRAPHVSFAAGGHFTLGAELVRMELRILFEELLQRFPEILPAGPTEHADSNHENRVLRLPVHLGTPV